ncbi:hypothetical protein FE265_14275 [Salmonella enterica subsp. enterica serovar Infantis]|nr:hypothetical protein FE265_14275 [Salmonella enterica subsp. enterica serovar Infantis]QCV30359.1 hypothetical protein FE168_14265 [Salmonella enterica subsp. enterica serovar Infantis]
MANSRPGQISPKTPGIHRGADASKLETVIKIVLHEGKPIHFATTVIALSSDRYLEMCDLYSSQAIE